MPAIRGAWAWPWLPWACMPLAWLSGTVLAWQAEALWFPPGALAVACVPVLAGLGCVLGWALTAPPTDRPPVHPALSATLRLARRGGGGLRAGGPLPVWGLASPLLALALALAALAVWHAHARQAAVLAQRLPHALEGVDLLVEGRVAGLVQAQADGLHFAFEPVAAHDQAGRAVAVPRLWVSWPSGEGEWAAPPPLAGGEHWRLPLRLRRPHGLLNPGGFDAELWASEQGIGALGRVPSGRAAQASRLAPARPWHPTEALSWLRQRLRDRVLLSGGPAREVGVLAALAVGDQAAIGAASWEVFRATGVTHLMSISGLHITAFAWLAATLLRQLWRRWPAAARRWPAPVAAQWGGLALATAYAALSGWGVPAQRTVYMLGLGLVIGQLGWRWPALLRTLWAAALVVVLDPWAVCQPGFWLSFCAVGLLLSAPPAAAGAPERPWRERLRAALREGWWTQWRLGVGLAPLTLWWFNQFSVVGWLTNLVAVPWLTFVVTPLALLGLLAPPALTAASALCAPLINALAWAAGLPLATWSVAEPGAPAAWLAMLGALCLTLRLPLPVRALAGLCLLPALWPALPRPPEGHFELLAADVGQGSAVMVRTRRHLLLHDAGPRQGLDSDAGQRVLTPWLRARGEARIDELVLSHRDQDHVGGAASLLKAWPVGRVRHSVESDHPLLDQFNGPAVPCQAGQRWRWDGVEFEVLHPPRPGPVLDGRTNAASCVLQVRAADGRAALLTGDIGVAEEQALVTRVGARLRSEVLVVPHHGSRSSSSEALLVAVAPRWGVIQVGYRSRFGHPHAEVLTRYEARGITVVRTDWCGAWVWREDGAACTRMVRRRLWHDVEGAPASANHGALVAITRSGEPE